MVLKRLLGAAAAALPVALLAASSYFPEFYHLYAPVPGGWSRYALTDAAGETATLTFAVVGEEKGSHWLEVTSASEAGTGVVAYLASGDPTRDENVLKVRVRDGAGPLMEIDRDTLRKLAAQGGDAFGSSARPIGPTVGKLHPGPDEVVEVAGRPVVCQRMTVVAADGREAQVWISEKVTPFGIVKLVSGEERVLLQDFGTGAKPALSGKAVPLRLE